MIVFCLLILTLLAAAYISRRTVLQLSEKTLWRAIWYYMSLVCLLFMLALPEAWLLKSVLMLSIVWLSKKAFTVNFGSGVTIRVSVASLLCLSAVLLVAHAPVYIGRNFVHDWSKHRTILASLVDSPTHAQVLYTKPPIPTECSRPDMVFYYGQYAPPAFMFRLLQPFLSLAGQDYNIWLLAGFFSFWCLTITLLCFCLLPLVLERQFAVRPVAVTGVLTITAVWFFSGLDNWYIYLSPDSWPQMPFNLGWYNSLLKHWTWAPQHLVTSLVGVFTLFAWRQYFTAASLAVWSVFIAVSSPLVYVGLLPLAALLFANDNWSKRSYFRWWLMNEMKKNAVIHVVHIGVLGVLFFYYTTKQFPELLQLNPYIFVHHQWFRLIIFYVVELTPFAVVALLLRRLVPCSARWWLQPLSFGVLLLLPLLHLGKHNDLMIRGSLPYLLTLLLLFAGQLTLLRQKSHRLYVGICLMALVVFMPHQLYLMKAYLQEQQPTYMPDNQYLFQYVRFNRPLSAETDYTVSGWANDILCN